MTVPDKKKGDVANVKYTKRNQEREKENHSRGLVVCMVVGLKKESPFKYVSITLELNQEAV
jgi:hypothetical protein